MNRAAIVSAAQINSSACCGAEREMRCRRGELPLYKKRLRQISIPNCHATRRWLAIVLDLREHAISDERVAVRADERLTVAVRLDRHRGHSAIEQQRGNR